MKYILLLSLLITNAHAKNYLDDNLRKLTWNGMEVVWLEDDTLPTYDVTVYFSDGALGDDKSRYGETEMMLEQLSSGTHRYSKKEIVEALEFYGASFGNRVTHEYSTFNVTGLIKDFIPTMKMVCHLFDDATFPKKELKKTKARYLTAADAMVTNHGALASHIFRYESLKNTGFESPVGGSVKSINRINSSHLSQKLAHFNKKVQKRIYIKGPKGIKALEPILKNDCRWGKSDFKRSIPVVKNLNTNKEIIFIPVPNANQAQVRVGRYLTSGEVQSGKHELKTFSSKFLGGGFISRLNQTLRVERGLTYSVGSYASEQKMYGRSGISTFTKNETIVKMLNSIKEVVAKSSKEVPKEIFSMSKRNMRGNYLLGLESTSDFLQNLLHFDHIGRDYSDIYKFSDKLEGISTKDLTQMVDQIFNWDKQTVLVLGNKNLVKDLKKAGFKVSVKNYKNYL